MPNISRLIRSRSKRRAAEHQNPAGKIGLGCAGLISILLAAAGLFTAIEYSRASIDLPAIEVLPGLLSPPDGLLLHPTRIYDREGKIVLLELQNPAAAAKKYLRLPDTGAAGPDTFAEALIQTTLAAEDPQFWTHPGISLAGLFPGGKPSIAQQLASETLLVDEPPSLRRDLRERILAVQITRRYGRAQVLEWYLNSADYGRLAHGADAAARVYLGKSASELDLAEAALIAGAAVDPLQNPLDTPQAALAAQKRILLGILEHRLEGWEQAAQASQQKLNLITPERIGQGLNLTDLDPKADLTFLSLALDQVQTQIPRSKIFRGGLKIITTLDAALQADLICAARAQQTRLSGEVAPELPEENCPPARLLPDLKPGPSIATTTVEAAILDPQTGQILALLLGEAKTPPSEGAGLMPVVGAETDFPAHPIGELGYPFIYLTAFSRGLSPASLAWDIPTDHPDAVTSDYQGPVRLRTALANDDPYPVLQLLAQIRPETVWRTAAQFGLEAPQISSQETPAPLTLFRPFDVVEIAHAYGVLANAGFQAGRIITPESGPGPVVAPLRALSILKVEDLSGAVRMDWSTPNTRPIVSSQLAYLITNVLGDEPARWASLGHPNPLEVGRPAAAKLGSSPNHDGAWALGYTPDRVIAIWVGQAGTTNVDPDSAGRFKDAAAGLYHALLKTAVKDLPPRSQPEPEGIVTVRVCDPGGMLPNPYCPNVVDEIFLAGSEPLQPERLFRSVQVNRETGRLATIFTPPDLTEDLLYISAPPEAAEWVRGAGMKAPPTVYDTLTGAPANFPQARISSPEMFSIVRGEVQITGTADTDDLLLYRLQIGPGLNPNAWTQIGDDRRTRVQEGTLGTWDTRGLSGLYAIELMVVAADQSVQRSVVLVTVDNDAPTIHIISPASQEEIAQDERPAVMLLAEIEDALGIDQVEMYMDGILLAGFSQPPFAFYWDVIPGAHTLSVVAVDRAGNRSNAETGFTIR